MTHPYAWPSSLPADGQALLQTVLDNPYNYDVRLIMADWMDENGYSAWAELTRAGVEANRAEATQKFLPRKEEKRESKAFQAFLNWYGRHGVFYRYRNDDATCDSSAAIDAGFVRKVTCSLQVFMSVGQSIVACQPVQEVSIRGVTTARMTVLAPAGARVLQPTYNYTALPDDGWAGFSNAVPLELWRHYLKRKLKATECAPLSNDAPRFLDPADAQQWLDEVCLDWSLCARKKRRKKLDG